MNPNVPLGMLGFMISRSMNTARQAATTKTEMRNIAEDHMREVHERLDGLELACAGLWDLLKFKHGYSDDELINAIRTIDARDGEEDGKITRAAQPCPNCNRAPLVRNPKKCSWCGTALPPRVL